MARLTQAIHPDTVIPAIRSLELVCPLCKQELDIDGPSYRCPGCERHYPVIEGIPDFRVFPDPYLDPKEERERTQVVLDADPDFTLRELLEYYWSFSDVTPPPLRKKFVDNALQGEYRGLRLLKILASASDRHNHFLEIGCGNGNLLVNAHHYFDSAVGIDIAMRWLQLSKKRFFEKRLPLPALICCCAEYLPFRPNRFDGILITSTLEIVRDPERVLRETARTLHHDGSVLLNTVNRYSLAKNPYVHLWGVGFLPRSWQIRYVRWARDASYENIRLFSLPGIRSLGNEAFADIDIGLADIDDSILATQPPATRFLVRVYRLLKQTSLIRTVMKPLMPEWDILLRRPIDHG